MPSSNEEADNDKSLELPGLSAPITITYDIWGVPHVNAASEDDLFFANGFVHARDRLWQMDAARRKALGRFAEWAGPSAVESDALMRRLAIESVSRKDYEALSPDTQRMCRSYSNGVNAFIQGGNYPIEYGLLEEAPEPWEPWHCVVVMRQRGLLMGSIWFKLWRAAAFGSIGAGKLGLLRYEDGGRERFVVPQERMDARWTAALEDLAPAIEGLTRLFPEDATGGGSNNWAVNAALTTTGQPILAGDPHRTYDIPSMYTQIHLTCDTFDVLGLSVPGVPATPHFGHNDRVAWGVTHAFADIHDLYVEDFKDQPPAHYRTEAGSEAASHRKETLKVCGSSDVEVDIWETRHGPVILGGPDEGFGIALKSMQLMPGDRSLDCLRPMMRANTVREFHDVMEPWGLIDHNLVAADRDDTIGVLIRARIPDRDRLNGWLPVPGWTGSHEWRGVIPFERMPRQENPPAGILVTANNRPVPEDWPDYICTDCHPSTRANRIYEILAAHGPLAPGDMRSVLQDDSSAVACEFRDYILAAAPDEGAGRRLVAALEDWDGRMSAALLAPTVYYEIRQEMTRILARRSGLLAAESSRIARIAPGISALAQLWWALPDQLRRDDVSLLGGCTWNEIICEAIETVAARFVPRRWGEAHRPRFFHPLAAIFPKDADRLAPDCVEVGGDGDCVLATGALPATGTNSVYGSVAKYIWDLSDWDRSSWAVFHGASGDPASPHFNDQNAAWATGELVPAIYSAKSVAAHAARTVTISPRH